MRGINYQKKEIKKPSGKSDRTNSKNEMKNIMENYNDNKKQGKHTDLICTKKLPYTLSDKQKELIKLIDKNKIITVTGPPGTSKTVLACLTAVQHLLNGKVNKIILSKPTDILSGTKDIGFLPGGLDEKMRVYVESFTDAFDDILLSKDFKALWDNETIEFKPAQFMRGRTLKNAFIIIDEFQNFDLKTLKSIVTRLGKGSKMIFMGDTKQNDINKEYVAVDSFNYILKNIKDCAQFSFERCDIVREKILIDIIDSFENFEETQQIPKNFKNT